MPRSQYQMVTLVNGSFAEGAVVSTPVSVLNPVPYREALYRSEFDAASFYGKDAKQIEALPASCLL